MFFKLFFLGKIYVKTRCPHIIEYQIRDTSYIPLFCCFKMSTKWGFHHLNLMWGFGNFKFQDLKRLWFIIRWYSKDFKVELIWIENIVYYLWISLVKKLEIVQSRGFKSRRFQGSVIEFSGIWIRRALSVKALKVLWLNFQWSNYKVQCFTFEEMKFLWLEIRWFVGIAENGNERKNALCYFILYFGLLCDATVWNGVKTETSRR